MPEKCSNAVARQIEARLGIKPDRVAAPQESASVNRAASALVLIFYPFLGLLWSGAQKRLTRFGCVPHAISGVSIFAVLVALSGQAVFAVILLNTTLLTGQIMVGGMLRVLLCLDHFQIGPVAIPVVLFDSLLLFALVADVLVRYSRYLRDDQWSGGFLEWLVPHGRTAESSIKTNS